MPVGADLSSFLKCENKVTPPRAWFAPVFLRTTWPPPDTLSLIFQFCLLLIIFLYPVILSIPFLRYLYSLNVCILLQSCYFYQIVIHPSGA